MLLTVGDRCYLYTDSHKTMSRIQASAGSGGRSRSTIQVILDLGTWIFRRNIGGDFRFRWNNRGYIGFRREFGRVIRKGSCFLVLLRSLYFLEASKRAFHRPIASIIDASRFSILGNGSRDRGPPCWTATSFPIAVWSMVASMMQPSRMLVFSLMKIPPLVLFEF